MTQKIKLDPDMRLADFLKQYAGMVHGRGGIWMHTDLVFNWDGAYLTIVDKPEVPKLVLEDLGLTNQSPTPENNHQ